MSNDPADLHSLPQVSPADIVFVKNYLDGPLAGLCWYRQRIAYFVLAQGSTLADRTLAVFELTDEEIGYEWTLKGLFEQYVGTHWSCDRPTSERRMLPQPDYTAYVLAARGALGSAYIPGDRGAEYASRPPSAWISG